jgi:hypothetical protein
MNEAERTSGRTLTEAHRAEDLVRCPVCGWEARLDLSRARPQDLQHCGRVLRLIEEPPDNKSLPK